MLHIREDDLSGPEIAQLLQAHLDTMAAHSPPESVFALDLDALRSPDITFWTVWEKDELDGCGALRCANSTRRMARSNRCTPLRRIVARGARRPCYPYIGGSQTAVLRMG